MNPNMNLVLWACEQIDLQLKHAGTPGALGAQGSDTSTQNVVKMPVCQNVVVVVAYDYPCLDLTVISCINDITNPVFP